MSLTPRSAERFCHDAPHTGSVCVCVSVPAQQNTFNILNYGTKSNACFKWLQAASMNMLHIINKTHCNTKLFFLLLMMISSFSFSSYGILFRLVHCEKTPFLVISDDGILSPPTGRSSTTSRPTRRASPASRRRGPRRIRPLWPPHTQSPPSPCPRPSTRPAAANTVGDG